ncbi:ABC transporter [Ophiocordyceps camponoti-floridani]|uniref:ABC transporter n=1 Tax=Ophiocordyceps camponoti-floridani TaxID=2030778 RepID=A0A8H4Q9X7_9HYPO|nr:ABC transporter [Ophiocordyceps camponoti-floridani]
MDEDSSDEDIVRPARHDSLSLDDVTPVAVQIRNLSVSISRSPFFQTYRDLKAKLIKSCDAASLTDTTPLLHSVTTDLPPSSLTAIVGGSGSGKTTLLNALAERTFSSGWSQTGTATFNGVPGVTTVRHAYVTQQDIFLPTLTVRETLQYAAELRLPASTPAHVRHTVVEEVIRELGLRDCADTRLSNSQHRGCSGGEKRRVSIGVQLLANPSVLFLDEPTTGLDASSAFQVVSLLEGLARKGRTVVMTVHQPRSEMWNLFDNLIVLSRGSPVYCGSRTGCLSWFRAQGFHDPPFVNPADHIVDTSAVDSRTPQLEEESLARVAGLKAAWQTESASHFGPVELIPCKDGRRGRRWKPAQSPAGFFRQLRVLTGRTLKVTFRDRLGMAASVLEGLLMGLLTGCLFFDVGRDQAGIRSRQGALFTAAGLQGYLVLLFEVYRMTMDIGVFDREAADGCVDPVPFILSRRLARLPTEDIPVPLLYTTLFYFMAGFDHDASKFLVLFVVTLLSHYIAVMCAMTCVVAVRHFSGASLMANMVFTLQNLACGMLVQSNSIPAYVRWLKWITYTFYAFGAYAANEFQDSFYDCPDPRGDSSPACAPYTGEFVMDSLGFPRDWIARPMAAMAAFIVFFSILSTIGLHLFKPGLAVAGSRASDNRQSDCGNETTMSGSSIGRTVDLSLRDFTLALDKRTLFGKRLPRKTILQPINASFPAGVLNVIMGPSGSGKTSLLDSMALRLRNSMGTEYARSGCMTLNGALPTDAVVRAVCSYVCQEDDALLPSLTVRETLRFAACLRLPASMSTADKRRRAEEVLMRMGLKDCADNLIGSDMVKGISGGEKRRVSIAIQILTDPRILMLDEPTSGLDAFTARSILTVLSGLADEGRTIILTIHQARSDLFDSFGNVLLLARGGETVFTGPARDMLGYLGGRGHECSRQMNPADFALDLVTVDLRSGNNEKKSRSMVQSLIEGWKTCQLEQHINNQGLDTAENKEGPRSTTTTDSRPSSRQTILPAELGALVREPASFSTALPLLLHRAALNIRRQPALLSARTTQVLGFSLVLVLFFAPLKSDYIAVQNRMGLMQELGALYFIGMLQNVAVYPDERDVFYREADDGVYGVPAFLASYTIVETPFEIISSLLFAVLTVFVVGLPRTVTMWLVSAFICFGVVSCGESLGIMFNTLFRHTGFAVNLMGIILAVASVMAGIVSIDMPGPFQAVNYLSPIRYAVRAVAPYAFRGLSLTCTAAQRLPEGICPVRTGEQALELYKLDVDPVVSVAAMAGCVLVYRASAVGLLLLVRRWRLR